MRRIQLLEEENASETLAATYDAVKKKLGLVPNMVKALGNSPAALDGYLGLSGAVSGGTLRPAIREKIALRVAEINDCSYCLSAHTAIGGMLKIPAEDLLAAREGDSPDPREKAILDLVQAALETRGAVPDETYESVKAAGVTDAEAIEVVANIAVNLYTNFFNRFAQTEIDFPKVEARSTLAAT